MTLPLIVLAFCTVGLSLVLTPAWPWLDSYLTGHRAHFDARLLSQPMIFLSLVLVGAGIAVGVWIYRPLREQDRHLAIEVDPLENAQPALFRFLENRMWLDELYGHTVLRVAAISARFSDWMDRYFWDGIVRGIGLIGQVLGVITRGIDERGINAGVDESTAGARGLGRFGSRFHSGQIQRYLGAVAIGMLALLLLYAWLA
jgi:NADH-quinone oxidoreductase subunit L